MKNEFTVEESNLISIYTSGDFRSNLIDGAIPMWAV